MRCTACDLVLAVDDNYCRQCGAPARVLQVAPVASRLAVMRAVPPAPALAAAAVRPLATGAAAAAAGVLLRFVLRRALRGLAGSAAAKALHPTSHALPAIEPQHAPATRATVQITEVIWYRRLTRTEHT